MNKQESQNQVSIIINGVRYDPLKKKKYVLAKVVNYLKTIEIVYYASFAVLMERFSKNPIKSLNHEQIPKLP